MQSTLPRTVSLAYFEKTRRLQGGFSLLHSDMRPWMYPAALALRVCRLHPEPARPLQFAVGNVLTEWTLGTCLHRTVLSAQAPLVTEARIPCR